ncbi:MAG: response regulator [Eubacteriales bacterium]|nr:response regulator [Eubacteriales bacterium]
MIRVVIADDEYFARKVLVKMVRELPEDIEICGEAETGIGVLEIMEQEPVDMVITDIRMPDMDGLVLAREIFSRYPDTSVIIESGYADFDYATTAIRYGVKDYLTKPVKREELEKAIRRVEAEKRKASQRMEKKLAARKIQYMDFSRILENEELGRSVLDAVFQEMEGCIWYLAAAQCEDKRLQEEQIQEILEVLNREDRNGCKAYFFYPKEEFILILGNPESDSAEGYKLLQRGFLECEKRTGVKLHGGLSLMHKSGGLSCKELSVAYREAVYAVNQRLLQPGRQIYRYEPEVNVKQLFTPAEERELEQNLMENRTEEAESIAAGFFRHCREYADVSIYSLFTSLIQIINVVNRVYGAHCGPEHTEGDRGSYLLFSFKTDLYAFRTLEELERYILQLFRDVSDEEGRKSTIIEDLLPYLERNYQYNITVNELAAHKYFVNPSYLSRLFKAETGRTFSRYLKDLRIEKAAGLLKESGLKISDVALCVGFNDVSYFIQTFRKYYEMTPEQYRNMAAEENKE